MHPERPQKNKPHRDRHRKVKGRGSRPDALEKPALPKGERIAKVMARAGLCSRRDAEAWIAEGRVAVNGVVLSSPAVSIGPNDKVSVDGAPLAERQRTRLFLFHKPRGLVTTNKDPEGRETIFDYLQSHHPDAPRLVSVGRLDINTEGLILLTNDGGLARTLELPSTGWLRRYRVRANGETTQPELDRLADGIDLDGIHYAGIDATLDRAQGANCWLTMSLREGKNREIKRVLEHLGLFVNRLIRLSFGPFQLGELAEGALEEVRTRVLRDQLGTSLLQESGADLDAPLEPASREEQRSLAVPAPRNKGPRPARLRHLEKKHSEKKPAEPEKPKGRPLPGPRKHVSALRAEAKAEREKPTRPRHRTERAETKDRRGRAVVVERLVATGHSPRDSQRKPSPETKQKWSRQPNKGKSPQPNKGKRNAPSGGRGRRPPKPR